MDIKKGEPLIVDDKVAKIADKIEDEADKVIGSRRKMGLHRCFIDLHVHVKEYPGFEYKRNI